MMVENWHGEYLEMDGPTPYKIQSVTDVADLSLEESRSTILIHIVSLA